MRRYISTVLFESDLDFLQLSFNWISCYQYFNTITVLYSIARFKFIKCYFIPCSKTFHIKSEFQDCLNFDLILFSAKFFFSTPCFSHFPCYNWICSHFVLNILTYAILYTWYPFFSNTIPFYPALKHTFLTPPTEILFIL